MIQIISGIFTVLILVLVFMRTKEKLSLKKMSLTAILLGVALVLTMVAIPVFFFGGQVVIRFSQLCLILIGASLGPIYGALSGLAFDFISIMINPLGSFYVGFTLNNILVGLIPALVFKYLFKRNEKFNLAILVSTLMAYLLYIVTVVGLMFNYSKLEEGIASVINFNPLIFISLIVIIFVLVLLYAYKRGIKFNNDFTLLLLSIVLIEFIIQGFLTPLWLNDMMGTPIILSMQIRALKGIVMISINMFMGYPVFKLIKRRFINK